LRWAISSVHCRESISLLSPSALAGVNNFRPESVHCRESILPFHHPLVGVNNLRPASVHCRESILPFHHLHSLE
jgi:hypothetical protein